MLLLFIYLVFIGVGLPDSLLGAAWPFMATEFNAAIDDAGMLSVMISIGIIAASLLSSKLSRSAGFAGAAAIGLALMAAALAGYALTDSFGVAALCSAPLGFGSGTLQTLFNEYVAENYTAKHMSWLHGTWGIGAVAGPLLVARLANTQATWHGSYLCIAAIELLLLLLLGVMVFSKRKQTFVKQVAKPQQKTSFSLQMLKGKACMIGQFFLYCSMENSVMLWGASYLVAAKQMDAVTAATGASVFFLGITLGRFIGGILLAKIKVKHLLSGCVAFSVLMCIVLLFSTIPAVSLGAFFLLGCCMAPIYPATLHQSPSYFPGEDQQLLMGIQVAGAYVGILILPPLLGKMYAAVSFNLLPVVIAIGLIGVLLCVWKLMRHSNADAVH